MNLQLPSAHPVPAPWLAKHVDPTLTPDDPNYGTPVRKPEKPKKRPKDEGPTMTARPRPKKPYQGPQD